MIRIKNGLKKEKKEHFCLYAHFRIHFNMDKHRKKTVLWILALNFYFFISIKFWFVTDSLILPSKVISPQHNYTQETSSLSCETIFKQTILYNSSFNGNFTEFRNFTYKVPNNGCWKPNNCLSQQKLAVIVAYRDRRDHLTEFIDYMHEFLQAQLKDYCIVVSEQFDKGPFNRGKLFNIGYEIAVKEKPDCFVFHDVDLLPENLKNWYGCSVKSGNHLCDKIDKYDYRQKVEVRSNLKSYMFLQFF